MNWLTPTKVRQLTVTGERGMFAVDYLNQHLTLYENAQASETWHTLDIFDGVTEGNVIRCAINRAERCEHSSKPSLSSSAVRRLSTSPARGACEFCGWLSRPSRQANAGAR